MNKSKSNKLQIPKAVALQYSPGKQQAPRVIGKGKGRE